MVSKVINDNCFVDNFLCKAALNSAKGLQVLANQIQVKASNIKEPNHSCCIHDIVTTKARNLEFAQFLPAEGNFKA